MKVLFKKLDDAAHLPDYAHATDAGCDLYALSDYALAPGQRVLVRTGIAMAIPEGYVGLIWDKSGVSAKQGLHRLGGVIDAGYRGEIQVIIVNLGSDGVKIEKGQKIAQMLFQKIEQAGFDEARELPEAARGTGGFGSTGLQKKEGKP